MKPHKKTPGGYSQKYRKKTTGIRAKKKFGQNFLVDQGILSRIVEVADVQADDVVLEIGPGTGNLTEHLLSHAKKVIAVEIDRDMVAHLEARFLDNPKLVVIEADILKTPLEQLLDEGTKCEFKVVANLPYYITTPILMTLLEGQISPKKITVMVQKEVGLRMVASPGSKDYGALSVAVAYYTHAYKAFEVPASAFRPIPKVDSCVVCMGKREPILNEEQRQMVFSLVKAAFAQRRKTLANALNHDKRFGDKADIIDAIRRMGFSENIRGEMLGLEDYIALSRYFVHLNPKEQIKNDPSTRPEV